MFFSYLLFGIITACLGIGSLTSKHQEDAGRLSKLFLIMFGFTVVCYEINKVLVILGGMK